MRCVAAAAGSCAARSRRASWRRVGRGGLRGREYDGVGATAWECSCQLSSYCPDG